MDQREKVSEDAESPSHFFGTIWSTGVASDEASELRCSALFLSDMPDFTRWRFWTLNQHGADAWRTNHYGYRLARSVASWWGYFATIRPVKSPRSLLGKRLFTPQQRRAAACPDALLSPSPASPAGPVHGLTSAAATLHSVAAFRCYDRNTTERLILIHLKKV